eukprot:5143021-Karenia_brevis.AAC.1
MGIKEVKGVKKLSKMAGSVSPKNRGSPKKKFDSQQGKKDDELQDSDFNAEENVDKDTGGAAKAERKKKRLKKAKKDEKDLTEKTKA